MLIRIKSNHRQETIKYEIKQIKNNNEIKTKIKNKTCIYRVCLIYVVTRTTWHLTTTVYFLIIIISSCLI